MKETIDTIIDWQKNTFPDANLEGQREKFLEELREFYNAQTSQEQLAELVDMFIVACGVARFDTVEALSEFTCVRERGNHVMINWSDFEKAVDSKLEKNRKRIWNKTGNGTYHHKNGIED